MTQRERAKLFMPFDAMKGLKEALRKREERHLREERAELSEDRQAELSATLRLLEIGTDIAVRHYRVDRYIVTSGTVSEICPELRYLLAGDRKIRFEDIYDMKILT